MPKRGEIMQERDLNETLSKADAYERAQEQIGDLAAQLQERDLLIRRLEDEAEAAEERARMTEAREAELRKTIEELEHENALLRNTKPATVFVADDRLERMEKALIDILTDCEAAIDYARPLRAGVLLRIIVKAKQALEGGNGE